MPLKKLREQEKASTESLLAAIENKDRRFRLFQTIFMVGTFVSLIFIISGQQQTLTRVQEQQKQAEKVALDTAKRSQGQQDKIIRHLNCMVVFFSDENRSGRTIEDIDACTLNRDRNVQQFFHQPEPIPAKRPPTVPGPISDSAPVPREMPAESPSERPPVVEPRPPVTIQSPLVNIPLCVPLTGICIR